MSPLAQKLWDLAKEAIEHIKALKNFSWSNFGVITDLISTLVLGIEEGQEYGALTGVQKKALVIEVLEAVIDIINLKLLPIWIPQAWVKAAIKKLLPILIDWLVGVLNKTKGFSHK